MTALALFKEQALATVQAEIERLRTELSFSSARDRPEAEARDVVVAGKEVQLAIFRQTDLPTLMGKVLITVQLARMGLGGMLSFRIERGLVFAPEAEPRDATEAELQESGG